MLIPTFNCKLKADFLYYRHLNLFSFTDQFQLSAWIAVKQLKNKVTIVGGTVRQEMNFLDLFAVLQS